MMITCDRQALPPTAPSALAAVLSGSTANLSWTDNSSDETGFKILRLNPGATAYTEIGTVGAGITTYADTLTTAGDYYYYVKAYSGVGDSFISKLVTVELP